MTQTLTLEDVGIPNYLEVEYHSLPALKEIEIYHTIRENGLTLDSIISEEIARRMRYIGESREMERRFKTKGWGLGHSIETVFGKRPVTYREIGHFLDCTENQENINKALGSICGTFNNPYFTHSFACYFEGGPFRSYRDRKSRKVLMALDRLTSHHPIFGVSNQDTTNWENCKLIYPYYITLKRQGISEHPDLFG